MTCEGGREARAALEMMDLFTDFLERTKGDASTDAAAGPSGAVDIAAALATELDDMKDKDKRPFWYITTGKGTVFVQIKDASISPTALCVGVAKDIIATQVLKSRFVIKVLPVETSCFASLDEIRKMAKPAVEREFPGEGKVRRTFRTGVGDPEVRVSLSRNAGARTERLAHRPHPQVPAPTSTST